MFITNGIINLTTAQGDRFSLVLANLLPGTGQVQKIVSEIIAECEESKAIAQELIEWTKEAMAREKAVEGSVRAGWSGWMTKLKKLAGTAVKQSAEDRLAAKFAKYWQRTMKKSPRTALRKGKMIDGLHCFTDSYRIFAFKYPIPDMVSDDPKFPNLDRLLYDYGHGYISVNRDRLEVELNGLKRQKAQLKAQGDKSGIAIFTSEEGTKVALNVQYLIDALEMTGTKTMTWYLTKSAITPLWAETARGDQLIVVPCRPNN